MRYIPVLAIVGLAAASMPALAAPPISSEISAPARGVGYFVQHASSGGLFEIESSKLALEVSQNDQVKAFAQEMVDSHTTANDELQKNLTDGMKREYTSSVLDGEHTTLLNKLKGLSGEEFDREYAIMQVKAHTEAVELYQNFIKTSNAAPLSAYAGNTLPTLKEHLDKAEELQDVVEK